MLFTACAADDTIDAIATNPSASGKPTDTPTDTESTQPQDNVVKMEFLIENDKFTYVQYDPNFENFQKSKVGALGLSFCSTQNEYSGVLTGPELEVEALVTELMDVFKHPAWDEDFLHENDESTYFVVTSNDFDPTTFMYPDSLYVDEQTNTLYIVFARYVEHKKLFSQHYDGDSSFVNEQSKATYTLISVDTEELSQYDHICFTTRPHAD
jgi:hypothetical protein